MTKAKRAFCYFTTAIIFSSVCLNASGAGSEESDNSTPKDVYDGMRESFRTEKAKGVHVRYQWQLSGANGGQWWIEVNDGKCKIDKGKIDNANVTFIASDKDWVALSNGKLKGWWAYLTGRLTIRGDQSLARKLDEMFN